MRPIKRAETTHACPCGCGAEIPRRYLSCPGSWWSLPAELRARVRRARKGSGEHLAAVGDAIVWLKGRDEDPADR